MNICKTCGNEHNGAFGTGKFCSRSCANKRVHSQATKEKMRRAAKANPSGAILDPSLRGRKKKNPAVREQRTCPTCGTVFETFKTWGRVHCTKLCIRRGGKRLRSGRGRSGQYRGFFLNSTYELAYLIYCLDHNIPIKRCDEVFKYCDPETNKVRKYYPDFVIHESTIVEIKGYRTKTTDAKKEAVEKTGRSYQILFSQDLKKIFSYIEIKTQRKIKDLYYLYD